MARASKALLRLQAGREAVCQGCEQGEWCQGASETLPLCNQWQARDKMQGVFSVLPEVVVAEAERVRSILKGHKRPHRFRASLFFYNGPVGGARPTGAFLLRAREKADAAVRTNWPSNPAVKRRTIQGVRQAARRGEERLTGRLAELWKKYDAEKVETR